MEVAMIIIGVLVAQAILGGTFYLGYIKGNQKAGTAVTKKDDVEKLRMEKLQKAFTNVMSYDVSQAMKRRNMDG